MANRIPDTFIAEVRQKINIVDVIGQYTTLVKRGRQWSGSCPFHDDRHPSLFVEENKQVFNCFSCGRSGSVFSFVMEKEGLSYPESVIFLADMAGISIDNQLRTDTSASVNPKLKAIYGLHTTAQQLYQHILLNTTSGEAALQYLHEKRKLTDDVIRKFGIGFVPTDNSLLNFAKEKNIERDILLDSELFSSNDEGDLRERFSGRVVWPINNDKGQVVGFSGRSLEPNNPVKYMNSPESPIFNKGHILYNFDRAKYDIRQSNTVLVFEGFMDVISADMAGHPMSVATMGTALTESHVRQLVRLIKRILLVYDGDNAGQNATRRAIHLIQEQTSDIEIGIVQLPDKLDPDEVRIQRGADVLQEVLDQHIQTPIQFLINAARIDKNLNNQVQYLAFLQEVMLILKQASPVEQDMQLTQISKEFGTDKQALISQLQQTVMTATPEKHKINQHVGNNTPNIMPSVSMFPSDNQQFANKITQIEQAERALIMAMIKSPQILAQVNETSGFAFVHPEYQLLMMLITIYHQQNQGDFNLAQFMDFIQKPELNQKIISIDRIYGDLAIEKSAISDYLRIIMRDAPVESQIKELQQQIDVAKQQHDDNKLLQLMTELINLKKQQHS